MTKEDTTKVLIRLPLDVNDWVSKEAARTLSSRNSEIIRTLRARMDSEQPKRTG
jgi:hypothetical protein